MAVETLEKIAMSPSTRFIAKSLKPHEKRAVRILHRRALFEFEPIGTMPGFAEPSATRLIELGLAEAGKTDSIPRGVGYRLTELGFEIVKILKDGK